MAERVVDVQTRAAAWRGGGMASPSDTSWEYKRHTAEA
jgi:hypothetical protein